MLIFTFYSVQGSWQGLEGQARELQDWASAGTQAKEYALGWEASKPDTSTGPCLVPLGPATRTGNQEGPGSIHLDPAKLPHIPQAQSPVTCIPGFPWTFLASACLTPSHPCSPAGLPFYLQY